MNQKPELQDLWSNPSERVVYLFKAVHKIYRDQIYEKSRQYGFTGPQIGLIIGLSRNPYITLKEMSECLGLSKSTVSGMVDRLVGQGVVIREIPEDNRRTVRLSISPDFQKNNFLKELANKYINDSLRKASEEDLDKIITGLEILHQLLTENE
ncbi:MarR family transcriptional regulator [Desulfosporosinus fructosivorans]|uniref:MarR family transcriptional regulator n=1 Tax=Desulfosporosinus fructosivorans TaxID=2018669 RepID=A0A4Z0R6N6_9FIRM|nr:MarR family transcriptional regulator [Desulfosporosinus fructosivorans]TGE38498.1 MarR family transcriptional regulator [Desulfosporosinus fructosivorans]